MKAMLVKVKNFIYASLMISVACYFFIRIISIILVWKFDFIIFFKNIEVNAMRVQPSLDILFSAICFMIAFIYFNGKKRVIISLLGLLTFLITSFMWMPVMLFAERVTNIEIPSQSSDYAVIQSNVSAKRGENILRVQVYKQHYPLLYKLESEKYEEFSVESDYETIELFNQKEYVYDEKDKTLNYGKMSIPLYE